MSFATAEWVKTQFDNFAAKVSSVFAKKTDVPSKVSELTNDSGFITNSSNDLANYYTKTETEGLVSGSAEKAKVFDTKSDLDTWIAAEGNTNTLKVGQNIYIKDKNTPDYWWDGTQLQPLETEKVNLDGYVTSEQLSTTLEGYLSTDDAETENIDFSGYFATE